MEQEEKELSAVSETENKEVVNQEIIEAVVEGDEGIQNKKTTKNSPLKNVIGSFGKKVFSVGKSFVSTSIDIGKNVIDKSKLESEFKKLCSEVIVHMLDNTKKNILAKIDTESNFIYTKDLIKFKDIKFFEHKKLGKYYYILNLKESKESISIGFKDEEHPYEVYAYEYTQEKPKEDIKPQVFNIEKIEQHSTIVGKNSVIGNNNDTSKSANIELSPTIKLPNNK